MNPEVVTTLAMILPPVIGVTVWLVRLEGKVSQADSKIGTLQTQAKASEETKIAVVRLEEQVKNLVGLLERYILNNGDGGHHLGR